jgi:signal transduction histidine kinase/DNA-binding response OmpR family regulator
VIPAESIESMKFVDRRYLYQGMMEPAKQFIIIIVILNRVNSPFRSIMVINLSSCSMPSKSTYYGMDIIFVRLFVILLRYRNLLKSKIEIPLLYPVFISLGCFLSLQPGKSLTVDQSTPHKTLEFRLIQNSFLSPPDGVFPSLSRIMINNSPDDEWSATHTSQNGDSGWKPSWAYLIYLSIIIFIVSGVRKYELSRFNLRNQMKIADIETRKLRELDQVKTSLLSNISQEIRTPLTLIKGSLDPLYRESDDIEKKKALQLISDNADRLLQLANQLSDLSLIQSRNYVVAASTGDITKLVKGVSMAYSEIAAGKNISMVVEEDPRVNDQEFKNSFYYDPDILETILNNLISNAIKYTPGNGRVTVKICRHTDKEDADFLELVVADTGIGIPEDILPYIYDHFYRIERKSLSHSKGSGVGLAYVRELVRLHKGRIRVKSIPDKGTVFSLRFPSGEKHLSAEKAVQEKKSPPEGLPALPQRNPYYLPAKNIPDHFASDLNKPWVLVVEDHPGVRDFIAGILENEYRIIHSSNAGEGIQKAKEFIPDLIISEVLLPGTDGYELCVKLKNSEKTSHVPVILLTASAVTRDKITGLGSGADDYIVKPFKARELKARVDNLIESRRRLREKFSSGNIINPGEVLVNSRDTVYMNKLMAIVNKNIGNHEFSVNDLEKEVGMSKSQLHRKLKALVNMSATRFIRTVRMHRAMELLQNDAATIAEIAYMVGYDDPGYFTKSFRNFFGKLPSEVIRKK